MVSNEMNPYPPVVNVTPPPQDPKATRKMFAKLSNCEQWDLYSRLGPGKPIILPRPTGEEPDDDEVNPLPVPEISAEFAEALKEDPYTTACWRCGKTDEVRKLLENGCILCAVCEHILKP